MDNAVNTGNREATRLRQIEGLEGTERLEALIGNQVLALNEWGRQLREYKESVGAKNEHENRVDATPGAHTLDHKRVGTKAAHDREAADAQLKAFNASFNKLKKALGVNLAHLFSDLKDAVGEEQAQLQIDEVYSKIADEEDRKDIHHRQQNEIHKQRNHAELSDRVKKSRVKKAEIVAEADKSVEPMEPIAEGATTPTTAEQQPILAAKIDEKAEVVGVTVPEQKTPAAPPVEEPRVEVIDEPVAKKFEEILGMSESGLTADKLAGYYPGGEASDEKAPEQK